jgi:hypothetical protein
MESERISVNRNGKISLRLNCTTLQTNHCINKGKFSRREPKWNEKSSVEAETSDALEARPSAPKPVYLLL